MMRRALAPLLVVLLLITACSGIRKGEVFSRSYFPPYNQYTLMCFSYDTKGFCTMLMPIVTPIEESWEICVQRVEDGKLRKGCFPVTQATYESVQIGDWFDGGEE
jgi:hypothetical protein